MPLAEAATRRGRSTIARNSYGSAGEYPRNGRIVRGDHQLGWLKSLLEFMV